MTLDYRPVLLCDDCQTLVVIPEPVDNPQNPSRPLYAIPANWRAVGERHYCAACKRYHAHERAS